MSLSRAVADSFIAACISVALFLAVESCASRPLAIIDKRATRLSRASLAASLEEVKEDAVLPYAVHVHGTPHR